MQCFVAITLQERNTACCRMKTQTQTTTNGAKFSTGVHVHVSVSRPVKQHEIPPSLNQNNMYQWIPQRIDTIVGKRKLLIRTSKNSAVEMYAGRACRVKRPKSCRFIRCFPPPLTSMPLFSVCLNKPYLPPNYCGPDHKNYSHGLTLTRLNYSSFNFLSD